MKNLCFAVFCAQRLATPVPSSARSMVPSETQQLIGREIADLAGGVGNVVARAIQKLESGNVQLACHLIDWAVSAEPDNKSAHEARVPDLR